MIRIPDIARAYGCGDTRAFEIRDQETPFARAARYFGPMFCHYDPHPQRWRLFGKATTVKAIVDAAQRRARKTNPGRVLPLAAHP